MKCLMLAVACLLVVSLPAEALTARETGQAWVRANMAQKREVATGIATVAMNQGYFRGQTRAKAMAFVLVCLDEVFKEPMTRGQSIADVATTCVLMGN